MPELILHAGIQHYLGRKDVGRLEPEERLELHGASAAKLQCDWLHMSKQSVLRSETALTKAMLALIVA